MQDMNKRATERAYYVVSEVATLLGISKPRVYQLLQQAKLAGHKRGSTWLISGAAILSRKLYKEKISGGKTSD